MIRSQILTSALAIAAKNCVAILGLLIAPTASVSQTTADTHLDSAYSCFPTDEGEVPFVFGFVRIEGKTFLQEGEEALPVDIKYFGDRWYSFQGDGFLGSRDRKNVLTFLNETGRLKTMQCVEITEQARELSANFNLVSELENDVALLRGALNAADEKIANLSEQLNAANDRANNLASELETLSASLPTDETGPLPLMESTIESFHRAIARCWNVDVGAEWKRVKVTVEFDLRTDGTLFGGIRLVSSEGGNEELSNAAFQAARRAVLRCGAQGYDLPPDQYERWKTMQVTFDPMTMRLE